MEYEKKGNFKSDSIFSKKLRAGKRRTYFFDVKATKANDYFLTVTESKKRHDDSYERFKIFVYKEDLNKFVEYLTETVNHIKTELMPSYDFDEFARRQEEYERNRANNIQAATEEKTETETEPETPPASEPDVENSSVPPPASEEDLKW